ncbi:trypsin-like peptidase domain-containing protein [Rhizobium sp. 768_B6_N1_8]|uniref:trypsin-like peptidase domain-containing protein n=1 Tax=unclassified Rhizobium TaxID=2613769 RepID=UPI003F271599
MRYYRSVGIAVIATAVIVFGAVKLAPGQPVHTTITNTIVQAPPTTSEDSVVMVNVEGGHGSGVHIGNGFVITAAHVASDNKEVELKTTDGKTVKAEVLWVNKAYDIALLRTAGKVGGQSSLDCRVPHLGDEIQAAGNPLNLEFVSSFGRIAGNARAADPWREVVITDITTVMGQSGGPLFGKDGRVVGIVVGVVPAPLKNGEGYVPSLTGFGTAVPASAVCALLGRVV